MSNATYNRYWEAANSSIDQQLQYERPTDVSLQPRDAQSAFQHQAALYIRYVQIFRRLEHAYAEMLHPQKRRLLKEFLVAVMGRTLELRHQLVDLGYSDFYNLNDLLLDMKLTPADLELPIPRYFTDDRLEEIETRRALLETLSAKDFSFGHADPYSQEMTIDDAIRLIQINERGRQGKLRAKFMRDIRYTFVTRIQAKKEKESISTGEDTKELAASVLMIQKVYRGHRARVAFKKAMRQELIFLGMEAPEPVTVPNINSKRRKLLQKQYEEDYLQALISTKEKYIHLTRIMRVEGPDMKEAMQDDFRQWYMEYKRANGKFPEFPVQEIWKRSGFKFANLESEIALIAAQAALSAKEDKPAAAAKEKKGDKKKGTEETTEEDPLARFKFDNSHLIKQMESDQAKFKANWQYKDESENFSQKHDQEIIKGDKRQEVEAEIKKGVFEILQDELKNLKLAIDSDKKGKKGKAGKKGKGKGKGKKDKKDKKNKKKEKDMTSNRTMESLVEELVQTGLLQKHTPIPLAAFKGEFDVMNESETTDLVIAASLSELKKTLIEYCILPFGLDLETAKIPKIASVLLYGPTGTGKTLLIRAIASELGAQIFNLSPRNTAGQYVGKTNVTKMLHMVFKVGRAQGPSIIYIDGIEMVFAKKIPKDDTSDPKRIKKDLMKSIKLIKDANEKVIIIASSSKPWEADAKSMLAMFEKVIYCRKPDYASRITLWKHYISKQCREGKQFGKAGNDEKGERRLNINYSLLTRFSVGMTAGSISAVTARVLTERRLKSLETNPFNNEEFLEHILTFPEEDKEEVGMFKDFSEKLSLAKKRASLLAGPEEDQAEAKKPAKKK